MFIKVKFLKSHPDYGYFTGDTGMISPKAAEKLLQGGYIMFIPEAEIYNDPIPEKVNLLPEDMPGRERLFDAGFTTIEEIKEAEIYNDPIPEKVNLLPEDMPERERLFDAGFTTIEEIKEAVNSMLTAGISNTILKKVKNYLKDK